MVSLECTHFFDSMDTKFVIFGQVVWNIWISEVLTIFGFKNRIWTGADPRDRRMAPTDWLVPIWADRDSRSLDLIRNGHARSGNTNSVSDLIRARWQSDGDQKSTATHRHHMFLALQGVLGHVEVTYVLLGSRWSWWRGIRGRRGRQRPVLLVGEAPADGASITGGLLKLGHNQVLKCVSMVRDGK
jgi:hypothetical protein